MNKLQPLDLSTCLTRDARKLLGLVRKIKQQKMQHPQQETVESYNQQRLMVLLAQSQKGVQFRRNNKPAVTFPAQLPVSENVAEITDLILNNQVVILAGETGSGKTTQLPKICLNAGLGERGIIAHTQPRRVAATSVAARIAEELNCTLGDEVGVAVRFFEKHSKDGYVKVMTDGMLLTEMQRDPYLSQYEVVIIDEAHERSINIDFLLGLLKQLLAKRRDLKLIVTSATIDVNRFSQFFNNAPIKIVEGRTFPVEICYLDPLSEERVEQDNSDYALIETAVKLACKQGFGDILIFLPGEGEIRQVAKYLRRLQLNQVHILPLYARLSISEQQKVFRTIQGRKIILATNVAETSLTVPGIKYVIDPGTARISRFSMRSKIQRLQIEKISKASANQRAGRCGRVAEGVCFRLYSEQDFNTREEFTLPEIKRTNLASVILQMKTMGIEKPEVFPLLESPESKHWKDGLNLLFELGAMDPHHQLTELGKKISKLPVDPKLAVMLCASGNTALAEMLIIASLYSVREPRERPHDKQQKADQLHARWNDKQSDFLSYINLWRDLHKQQEELTNKQFKLFCQENFINFVAYLEWRNTYRQLKQCLQEMGAKVNSEPATSEQIHRALLPALLSNVMNKTMDVHYLGARNSKVFIHPSSVNFKQKSGWLIAAELMETGKLYARTTAPVEPDWIEPVAEHVCKTQYLDPHWRKKKGEAVAYLQKSLFGLIYVQQRLVSYVEQEPLLSRQWLIEKGLIDGDIHLKSTFHQSNQTLLAKFHEQEVKQRRSDILRPESELVEWFEQRLPKSICNQRTLERWLKKDWRANNQQLTLTEEDILNPQADLDESAFPPNLLVRGSQVHLEYRFEPGHEDDGVSICLPLPMLNQFKPSDFDWLVPGLLQEKIVCSIKALPKSVRKNFIPAPEYAKACFERLKDGYGCGDFFIQLAETLAQISGQHVDIELWQNIELPTHLQPNFKVYSEGKQPLAKGRNLNELQHELSGKVKSALTNFSLTEQGKTKTASEPKMIQSWPLNWNFSLELTESGRQQKTRFLRALSDCVNHVKVVACESRFQAEQTHLRGVCRLLLLSQDKKMKYLLRAWQGRRELQKLATQISGYDKLLDDLGMAVCRQCIEQEPQEDVNSGNQDKPFDENILVEKSEHFQTLVARIEPIFTDRMNQQLTLVLRLLKQTKRINSTVFRQVEPRYLSSYQDIRNQLQELWFDGCVYQFGLLHLLDYERYLGALEKRLERLDINFPREQSSLEALKTVLDWQRDLRPLAHNRAYEDARQHLFWMIQEYRISLFAQGIKTAFPISEKRLKKQVDSFRFIT